MYWGKEADAVIDTYLSMDNKKDADRFFQVKVYPLLYKLSEGVLTKYIISGYSSSQLVQMCVSKLWEVLPKMDKDRGRYYSYLTRTAENYYKTLYNEGRAMIDIEDKNDKNHDPLFFDYKESEERDEREDWEDFRMYLTNEIRHMIIKERRHKGVRRAYRHIIKLLNLPSIPSTLHNRITIMKNGVETGVATDSMKTALNRLRSRYPEIRKRYFNGGKNATR